MVDGQGMNHTLSNAQKSGRVDLREVAVKLINEQKSRMMELVKSDLNRCALSQRQLANSEGNHHRKM
jgi:hypothetical protein